MFNRDYYLKLIKEYNYNPIYFGEINFDLGNMNRDIVQAKWLCHNNADSFALNNRKNADNCIVSTGVGLSGTPHMGTLSQILKSIALQKAGLNVQFVLGDLDAYNGKNTPIGAVKNMSKTYHKFIKKLGFDTDKGILRSQFEALTTLRTSYLLGKFATDEDFENAEEDLHSFYAKKGKVDSYMSYRRKLSLNLMTADFFDLAFSGYKNVLVMLGVDEHQYVNFSKTLLDKTKASKEFSEFDNFEISAIYSSMIKGFNNYPKMSKSFPESSINLDTPYSTIEERIMTQEGDYKNAEENVVFQMISMASDFDAEEIKSAYHACNERNENWSKYKLEYVNQLKQYKKLWEEAKHDS